MKHTVESYCINHEGCAGGGGRKSVVLSSKKSLRGRSGRSKKSVHFPGRLFAYV